MLHSSILLPFMLFLGHYGAGLHRLGFLWHKPCNHTMAANLMPCFVVLRAAFQLIASCQERQIQRFEYNEREAKFAMLGKSHHLFLLSQVDQHVVDLKALGISIRHAISAMQKMGNGNDELMNERYHVSNAFRFLLLFLLARDLMGFPAASRVCSSGRMKRGR